MKKNPVDHNISEDTVEVIKYDHVQLLVKVDKL